MKGKSKILIPLAIILLFGLSAYYLVSNSVSSTTEYETYLSKARKQAEVKTVYALEYYQQAIELNPSLDLYIEVSDYLKTLGNYKNLVKWAEKTVETYQKEPRAYDYLLSIYMDKEDYESCYDVLDRAIRRKVTSEYIDNTYKEIYYKYYIDNLGYYDAGLFSHGYAPVFNGELWSAVNEAGEICFTTGYTYVGFANEYGEIPVVTRDGEALFVNSGSERLIASLDSFKRVGPLFENCFAAQKSNNKYTYYNRDFEPLNENEYDYASSYNYGIAAVKVNGKWSLIDTDGAKVAGDYDSVVMDDKEIAYRYERSFVKSGNSYIMIDSKGTQIGDSYEDAKLFNTGGVFAAVKKNGKWGFVDNNGEMIIEPIYDDARSFTSELAAVKKNGVWGFIDMEGNTAVDFIFEDARDFSSNGCCFVKTKDGYWALLRLYRTYRG